jgi:hypothetical protein
MRVAYIAIASVVFAVRAIAQEFPTTGEAHSERENAFVQYSCVMNGTILDCDFAQLSVRKKLSEKEAKEKLKQAKQEFEAFKKEMQKEDDTFCKQIAALDSNLSDEKSEEEIRKTFPKFTLPKGPIERVDVERSIGALATVCKSPTLVNWTRYIEASTSIEGRTCKVTVNRYAQRFSQVAGTSNWVVLQQEGASGTCGVINVSRFEQSKNEKYLWDYFASKVVTNKSGEVLPGFKCSDLDESEYKYSWVSRDRFVGCDYVSFGGI